MKNSGTCPKCGCKDIIAGAKAVDRGDGNAHYNLSVAVDRKPQAMIFKGRQMAGLSAYVCARCGFVEFYADDARNLKLPNRL